MALKNSLRFALRYVISLLVAGGLLWLVFRNIDLQYMLSKLKDIDYRFIVLSLAIGTISHIARAYRWNLLLEPIGFTGLSTFRTFLAVMVGYIANLVFPRMGEVSKCGVLVKTDKIPLTTSLGTVVAERIIDLLSLIFVLALTFLIEFGRLKNFFLDFIQDKLAGYESQLTVLIIVAIAIPILILVAYFYLRSASSSWLRMHPLFIKIRGFLGQMVLGITSIRHLKKKKAFWFSTFLIWLCYFFMGYIVVFSLEETSGLGLSAGLSLLAMGSIGMAAPVQGGVGAFHLLVGSVLVLYGIEETDGILFATILHTSQALFIVVGGGISLILVALISGKKTKEDKIANDRK